MDSWQRLELALAKRRGSVERDDPVKRDDSVKDDLAKKTDSVNPCCGRACCGRILSCRRYCVEHRSWSSAKMAP